MSKVQYNPTPITMQPYDFAELQSNNKGELKVAIESIDPSVVIPIGDETSSTATESNVASSATSVTILAANAVRKFATVYNDSNSTLYLLAGPGTASTTNYTVQLLPGSYYELPKPVYIGQLTGIWAVANGNARVTEFT